MELKLKYNMKKLLLLLLLPFIFKAQNLPISGLPSATTLVGSEVVPIVQSGATKKATITQIRGSAATITLTGAGSTSVLGTNPYTITSSGGGGGATLTAGANVTVTGVNPYTITATGGGGTVSVPNGQFVIGNGSGITGTSLITYTNNTITAPTESLIVSSLSVTSGYNKLYVNSNGVYSSGAGSFTSNSAFGFNAFISNTTGTDNSAFGNQSLLSSSSGSNNTAIGNNALISNGTGNNNTAIGRGALYSNSNQSNNIGIGLSAGAYNSSFNNRIFINSIDRGSLAGDTTASPIYVYQHPTASLQKIQLNGNLSVANTASVSALNIGTTSTVGSVWTATNTTGAGTWSTVPSSGGGATLTAASNITITGSNPYTVAVVASPTVINLITTGTFSAGSTSTLTGAILAGNNLSVTGTFSTAGASTLTGAIRAASNLSVVGTFSAGSNSTLNGLTNTGGITTSTTFSCGTTSTLTGDVRASANMSVTGTFSAGGTSTVANLVLPSTGTITGYVNRIPSVTTQAANPNISFDRIHFTTITGLAQAITSVTMTGTPYDGQLFEIRITDNGTARAITWGSQFTGSLLPTTTVISTRLRIYLEYDSALSKWVCVGSL